MVRQSSRDAVSVIFRLPNEGGDMLIVDRIEHGRAVPTALHHPAIPKEAELMGDRRFRDTNQNCKVANGERASGEGGEHPNACVIGKRLGGLDDPLQLVIRRHGGACRLQRCRIERFQVSVVRHI